MHYKAKVFFLALLLLAAAGAAQAETIFPVGWTLTYYGTDGDIPWESTLSFTSEENLQMFNWENNGRTLDVPVKFENNTFYITQGNFDLQPFFTPGNVGYSWGFTADDGSTGTATVQAILNDFEVPAGKFDNVYQVYYVSYMGDNYNDKHMDQYMYWKPRLGLLKVEDRGLNPVTTHTLTAYATPLLAGVWLLGSGLLGLAALRRFRRR